MDTQYRLRVRNSLLRFSAQLRNLHATRAILLRPVLRLQDYLVAAKSPILDAREPAILRLSLAVAELLCTPFLRTLDTLPLRVCTKATENLCVEALVLLVSLGPAAEALVCKLE